MRYPSIPKTTVWVDTPGQAPVQGRDGWFFAPQNGPGKGLRGLYGAPMALGAAVVGLADHGLTSAQEEVLAFVLSHSKTEGYPPTRQEVADHFGWRSVNAAHQHLRAIEAKGYIALIPGAARGIKILREI